MGRMAKHNHRHEFRSTHPARRGIQHRHLYALFVLALATGMRQGELLALRWEDVDLSEQIVGDSV
jgi:integrase